LKFEKVKMSFVQTILQKLGCKTKRLQLQRSLQRDRLIRFDDSRSVHSGSDDIDVSPCPSDCSSCHNKEKDFENQ